MSQINNYNGLFPKLVLHTTNIYQIFKTSTTRFPIWAQASIIPTLKVDFFDNQSWLKIVAQKSIYSNQ